MRSKKSLKEELLKRGQESYEKKDETGRFGNIFKTGEKRLKFWKCGEGEHTIDILPWPVGRQYPNKNYPDIEAGDWAYILDIWVHRSIGADETTIVCLSRNYGKPCPVCEDINERRKAEDFDNDSVKDITPKRRSIYQILCYDGHAEEDKGVQVWDVAHFFMEKHLAELARKPRGGGFVLFADPEEGKQVYFKRKGSGQTSTEFLAHQFLDRDYKLTDDDLNETISIDDYLSVLSYEEIKDMHWGPAKKAEEPSPRRQRRSAPPPPSPEDDDIPFNETPKNEEAAPPTRRTRRAPGKVEEKVKEEEVVDKASDECPGGGTFGVSIEQLDHCNKCKVWDDCAKAADKIGK